DRVAGGAPRPGGGRAAPRAAFPLGCDGGRGSRAVSRGRARREGRAARGRPDAAGRVGARRGGTAGGRGPGCGAAGVRARRTQASARRPAGARVPESAIGARQRRGARAGSGRARGAGGGVMRVALVHDWLTGMRGGERVLEALIRLWPDAEIFTLLHLRGSVSPLIEERPIHTSFIDRLPGASKRYRNLLPLFPAAIERFDLRGFDLVVSSSHCVAKGVRPAGAPHLCYCHTPMRYVWDLYDDYFGRGRAALPVRMAMPPIAAWLRRWDRRTASRVDTFVAHSAFIRERIRRCYGRDAVLVHPPVAAERLRHARPRQHFYLIVSALVPYKRIELAIAAFNRLGRPLVIAGSGPELERLRRMARPNVRFTGWLPDDEIADLYERCRAFIFPGVEDFGITAVEA